jgi:hypothetical protein
MPGGIGTRQPADGFFRHRTSAVAMADADLDRDPRGLFKKPDGFFQRGRTGPGTEDPHRFLALV